MGAEPAPATAPAPSPRSRKFRQAAFVYLHVGLLYQFAVLEVARAGLLPAGRGPLWVWLVVGAVIVGVVFWGLWFREWVWMARIVWALHALRLPALISGAFFPDPGAVFPPSFWLVALAVVLFNLAMLARAGWDL